MAFDFPATPTTGQIYQPAGGPAWQYDGEKWKGGAIAGPQKEQFFDVSGKAYQDIAVPTWAKKCQLMTSVYVTGTNGAGLRISMDGTTFMSGAADYAYYGPYNDTGTNKYQTQVRTTYNYFPLAQAGDNAAQAQQSVIELDLVRPTTGKTFAYSASSRSMSSLAVALDRTAWFAGYIVPGSGLQIKALRIMPSAGSFDAGSTLHIKWLGDDAQIPTQNAIPDAPTTGGIYGRQSGAWVGVPGRNVITNGDFGVWQRGGSFATPASASKVADLWQTYLDGTGAFTISIVDVPRTVNANLAPSKYALRWNQTGAITGGTPTGRGLGTSIEGVHELAGKTVTLSFTAYVVTGTHTLKAYLFQDYGQGGSPSPQVTTYFPGSVVLTTTPTRYSMTVACPSLVGKTLGTTGGDSLGMWFEFTNSGVWNITIWDVQLEEGTLATPFERLPWSDTMARCQRYYQIVPVAADYESNAGSGACCVPYIVSMRGTPTVVFTPSVTPVGVTSVQVFGFYDRNGMTVAFNGATAYARNYWFGFATLDAGLL